MFNGEAEQLEKLRVVMFQAWSHEVYHKVSNQ
jgi:hypothetical protein